MWGVVPVGAVQMPRHRIKPWDVFSLHPKPLYRHSARSRWRPSGKARMGPEGVVGRHVDFDRLVEGVELPILRMVVVAPVGEHVARVGNRLHSMGQN